MRPKRNEYQDYEIGSLVLNRVAKWTIFVSNRILKASAALLFPNLPCPTHPSRGGGGGGREKSKLLSVFDLIH